MSTYKATNLICRRRPPIMALSCSARFSKSPFFWFLSLTLSADTGFVGILCVHSGCENLHKRDPARFHEDGIAI